MSLPPVRLYNGAEETVSPDIIKHVVLACQSGDNMALAIFGSVWEYFAWYELHIALFHAR